MPGTNGQERATMTAQMIREGSDLHTPSFRIPAGCHGGNRSLSALWEFFQEVPATHAPAVSDHPLQYSR